MILSVIVPVYNVQDYLDECIQSIINQTFTDFELILVNDGSTDSSGEICDRWAEKDGRIRVIHKQNSGPSDTRMTGIKEAKGQFLAFVDSDDKISPQMYETMLSVQAEKDYDYVICGLKRFFTEKDTIREEPAEDIRLDSQADIMKKIILPLIFPVNGEHIVSRSSTKNIYKKSIFEKHNISYKDLNKYFSEDLLMNLEYLLNCKNAASIPDTFYWYRANINSFTNTIRTDYTKLKSITNMYYYVVNLFNGNTDVKNRCATRCLELLSVFLRFVVKNNNAKDAFKQIRQLCGNKDVQTMLEFDGSALSAKNKLIKLLIAGKHSLILLAMITVYNKLYIQR